MEKEKES
jgi:hypothetical protein